MTDIFISYSSEDRERARTVATALQRRGWSVWWDRDIKAGQAFDQAIEHELETAKNVVVLWSKNSIASEWVKGEAAAAVQRGVLVPALIDNVKLPLEFSRRQTADLIGWEGDTSHAGFQALCDGIAGTAGMTPRSTLRRFRESASGTRLLESAMGIKGLVADAPRRLDGVGNLPCRPCGSCRRAESSADSQNGPPANASAKSKRSTIRRPRTTSRPTSECCSRRCCIHRQGQAHATHFK